MGQGDALEVLSLYSFSHLEQVDVAKVLLSGMSVGCQLLIWVWKEVNLLEIFFSGEFSL